MFKKLTGIFSIARKAIRSIIGKVNPWKSPESPTKPRITPEAAAKPEIAPQRSEKNKIEKPRITQKPKEETETDSQDEATEEGLAKEVIENLIDIVRSMDEEGYTPSSPHTWSINPEKAPNSGGAGRMKEESGSSIIEIINQAVEETDAITVARSLEQYWDGILYHIERLEYAIYDAEYRRRGGGRGAYEAGLLKLKGMLTIGSDEPVQGKNVNG